MVVLFSFQTLIRQIPFPVKIDTIRAKAYVGASTSPKEEVDIVNNISIDVENEHVLNSG